MEHQVANTKGISITVELKDKWTLGLHLSWLETCLNITVIKLYKMSYQNYV